MHLIVRQMRLDEVGLIIDYFHSASTEHLEMLGVDPTRLPERGRWRQLYEHDFSQPLEKRSSLALIWEVEDRPVGFSTADKIKFGQEAYMHLHVVDPNTRQKGYGAACVKQSTEVYFDLLQLERLFCEPHAFNIGPNRTLQKAGFRYVKTHKTVPGPLNFHQTVNRWVLNRE